MIFNITNNFTYEEGVSQTIYSANNKMILKRLPGTKDLTYTLSIIPDALILKKTLTTKQYRNTKNGKVRFEIDTPQINLDFVKIENYKLQNDIGHKILCRLYVCARNGEDEIRERSCNFTVVIKPKINSIMVNMKKKELHMPQDYYGNIYKQMERQRDYEDNGTRGTECPIEEIGRQLCNDRVARTHCLVFAFTTFVDPIIWKDLPRSRDNVKAIIKLFKKIDLSVVKMAINDTTKDFFSDITDYIDGIDCEMDQVIIFVMSHGVNGGFCTRDGFVTEEGFHNHLEPILYNKKIKKILLLEYCRKNLPISIDSKSVHDTIITDIIVSSGDRADKYYQTDLINDPISSNVFNDHPNVFIAHCTMPGETCYYGESGSFFIAAITDKVNDQLEISNGINLAEVVMNAIEEFKKLFIVNDHKRVYQFPCFIGSKDFEFFINKKKEAGTVSVFEDLNDDS